MREYIYLCMHVCAMNVGRAVSGRLENLREKVQKVDRRRRSSWKLHASSLIKKRNRRDQSHSLLSSAETGKQHLGNGRKLQLSAFLRRSRAGGLCKASQCLLCLLAKGRRKEKRHPAAGWRRPAASPSPWPMPPTLTPQCTKLGSELLVAPDVAPDAHFPPKKKRSYRRKDVAGEKEEKMRIRLWKKPQRCIFRLGKGAIVASKEEKAANKREKEGRKDFRLRENASPTARPRPRSKVLKNLVWPPKPFPLQAFGKFRSFRIDVSGSILGWIKKSSDFSLKSIAAMFVGGPLWPVCFWNRTDIHTVHCKVFCKVAWEMPLSLAFRCLQSRAWKSDIL